MAILRMLILAIVIALGTILLAWWAVPLVAAVYGVLMHRTRRPGLTAAVGGAPVGRFGSALAASMQLPGWGPLTATLVFPALLAGLAAYLGARVGGRYLTAP